ncbi:ROK family protein [Nocardioides sp. C4-1]|uniref:ROK family protein n=1 Tax=Nocardioides sp. C4-1 TaxID=3151851 RepID=UPI003265BA9C
MVLYVGVDVGGTKVLAGEVTRAGTVVRTARRSTPGRRVSVELVEDALTEAVLEVAAGRRIAGVGLAAAGFVDAAGERVMFAPHLPWTGDAVRERLSRRWAAPVALDNDANCAAVAETAYGAARGATSALVITLGTGIGGAYVLAGEVVRGAQGMAGEFGHMRVVPDGRSCECGMTGCWEQYCSGNALVRFARERMVEAPTVLTDMTDGRPERLTGPMVTSAAESGDLVARQAFAAIGEWLGAGVAGLASALDPEVVVVGGGVSAAGDRLLDPARPVLERAVVGAGHRTPPRLVAARLGPEAGIVGAALLARTARWSGSARAALATRGVVQTRAAVAGDYRAGAIRAPRRRRPGRAARGSW